MFDFFGDKVHHPMTIYSTLQAYGIMLFHKLNIFGLTSLIISLDRFYHTFYFRVQLLDLVPLKICTEPSRNQIFP